MNAPRVTLITSIIGACFVKPRLNLNDQGSEAYTDYITKPIE